MLLNVDSRNVIFFRPGFTSMMQLFLKSLRSLHVAVLLFLFIVNLTAQDGGWEAKISPDLLEEAGTSKPVPFLIILNDQADVAKAKQLSTKNAKGKFVFESLREVVESSQKDLVDFLDRNRVHHQPLFIINAIRAEATKEIILSLAQRPDVAKILHEPLIHYPEPVENYVSDPGARSVAEWGIERINADDVWAMGFKGQGVVVGGEDTGYEWNHPALILQYRGYDVHTDSVDHNYNWHDAIHSLSSLSADSVNPCGLDVLVPCDDSGHGTHTMGTMVGLDGENQIGVAPEAQWCGCRNMEQGWGTPFTYLECFQWFLAPTDLNNENPDPAKAPHVINNSWSCPVIEGCDSSNWLVLNQAINILRLAGIVVVVSAGNNGPGCATIFNPPGMFEESFSVGATAMNDTIANFSSRGPVQVDSSYRLKPNVSAPGVGIRSAALGGKYRTSSGTSMAGPHVAGLVALMISANPDLAGQVETIETIIEQTAVPKTTDQDCGFVPGSSIPNNTYGYGRIDALAAVEAALALIEVNVSEEIEPAAYKVFPNPFQSSFFISIPESSKGVVLQVFDLHGRIVLQMEDVGLSQLVQVDATHLPPGMYVFKILTNQHLAQGMIMKS